MDLVYLVTKFLHVAGALLLVAALAIEGGVLRSLAFAQTPGDMRNALGGLRPVQRLAPAGGLLVLAPGFYLAWDAWGLTAWLAAGVALVVVAMVMEVRVTRRLLITYDAAVIARAAGNPTEDLLRRLNATYAARVVVMVAIVVLMVIKPGAAGSTLVLLATGALAAVAGQWARGREARQPLPARERAARVIAIGDRARGR